MKNEPLDTLRQDSIGRIDAINKIYQRDQELQTKEAEWQSRRVSAQAGGNTLPPQWEDAEFQALRAERETIMADLKDFTHLPRLAKETAGEVRKRLSSEQRAQLQQEMARSLASTPAEIQSSVTAVVASALAKVKNEIGAGDQAA